MRGVLSKGLDATTPLHATSRYRFRFYFFFFLSSCEGTVLSFAVSISNMLKLRNVVLPVAGPLAALQVSCQPEGDI